VREKERARGEKYENVHTGERKKTNTTLLYT
jgi:hypothetical protein